MKQRFQRFLRFLYRWCVPLPVQIWLYRTKDTDKYETAYEDRNYKVVIFNKRVFGVWYQPEYSRKYYGSHRQRNRAARPDAENRNA